MATRSTRQAGVKEARAASQRARGRSRGDRVGGSTDRLPVGHATPPAAGETRPRIVPIDAGSRRLHAKPATGLIAPTGLRRGPVCHRRRPRCRVVSRGGPNLAAAGITRTRHVRGQHATASLVASDRDGQSRTVPVERWCSSGRERSFKNGTGRTPQRTDARRTCGVDFSSLGTGQPLVSGGFAVVFGGPYESEAAAASAVALHFRHGLAAGTARRSLQGSPLASRSGSPTVRRAAGTHRDGERLGVISGTRLGRHRDEVGVGLLRVSFLRRPRFTDCGCRSDHFLFHHLPHCRRDL